MKPILIKPEKNLDPRGCFIEVYNSRQYTKIGIDFQFVQDNFSLSIAVGTLRGLHFQAPPRAQGKLVSCIHGSIFDVVVDIRKGSPAYGSWEAYDLTAKNGHQLYVPIGFAHGFVTLMPNSKVIYKCTDYYAPESEGTIKWDSCGIEWPINQTPILSKKDSFATSLKDFKSPFVYGENS